MLEAVKDFIPFVCHFFPPCSIILPKLGNVKSVRPTNFLLFHLIECEASTKVIDRSKKAIRVADASP